MTKTHALEYTQDMPDVSVLPGEYVHIRSKIGLPGSQGTASIGFHAVPFQSDDFPEQWFYGFRLDLDVHLLRHYVHSELLVVARERATAISKKLQVAQCDFVKARVWVSPLDKSSHRVSEYSGTGDPLLSIPDASLVRLEQLSADRTVQHTDRSFDPTGATLDAATPHPPSQHAGRTPQVHSVDDRAQFPIPDTTEGETPGPHKRKATPYGSIAGCIPSPYTSVHAEVETLDQCQHIETPNRSPVRIAPPLVKPTASDGETPSSQSSFDLRPLETNETGVATFPTDITQPRFLACVQSSAPAPSQPYSEGSVSQASPAGRLSGLTPSSSLLESSSVVPPSILPDALAAVSRKRKRKSRDNSLVNLERQQDLSATQIAAKISSAIRLGGRKYEPSTFETWERDLWLLNPDRAKLTLAGLLTQQRTYTEALLCQGILARIIHSWCLIAYEHRLSTVDRSQSTRRNQKEIRLSLRCRKLGILFLEIINQLFSQPGVGIDAYKVCPAIAGKYSSSNLYATN